MIPGPSSLMNRQTASISMHSTRSGRLSGRSQQSGTGIILVTHNLHDIIPEISRVVLMKEGRFWKDGGKEEILTDANLGGLFHIPVHIVEEGGYYYATGY